MSLVGSAAGISPGTLYRFFSSIDEIADALLTLRSAELMECMADLADPVGDAAHGPPTGSREALLRKLASFYRARPEFLILLDWVRRNGKPPTAEAALERHFLPVLGCLLNSPSGNGAKAASPSAIVALEVVHAVAARASTMAVKDAEPLLKIASRALAALAD